jgi:hypothetical protein
MTNLASLGIGPATELSVIAATITAIQTKLECLANMPSDERSIGDLLDYSQLIIYLEQLRILSFS